MESGALVSKHSKLILKYSLEDSKAQDDPWRKKLTFSATWILYPSYGECRARHCTQKLSRQLMKVKQNVQLHLLEIERLKILCIVFSMNK